MADTYISDEWLKPLGEAFRKAQKNDADWAGEMSDCFGDPKALLECYLEPNCRYQDHVGNTGKTSCGAFDAINLFMGDGVDPSIKGGNQMLILGDSGMGKTSLLMVLKAAEALEYRPADYRCELIKLGEDALDRIAEISDPSKTALLLDALDEDPTSANGERQRLLDVLAASQGFWRVFVSCHNRYFFQNVSSQDEGDKSGRVGDFDCPMMVLLGFDDEQVEAYLDKRYPKQWRQKIVKHSEREAAFERVATMGNLKYRPQILSMIGFLLNHDEPVTEEYSLLEAVTIQWLIRENEAHEHRELVNVSIESLYDAAKRIAIAMAEEGIHAAPEERVLNWIQSDEENVQLQSVTFSPDSLLLQCQGEDGRRSYRFSHPTILEFFAAQSVLDSSGEEEIVVPKFAPNRMIDYIVKGRSESEEHREKKLILRDLKLATFGFEAADLKGAIIEGADLRNANFENADLRDVNFTHCRLDGAKFDQANTEGAAPDMPTEGLPVSFEIDEGVFLEMLWVEPGSFNIGNRDTPVLIEIEEGFWLGKDPVTQRQYEAIMGSNPSHFATGDLDLPVEQVSWQDAQEFCEELTQLIPEDLEEPFEFRLPKESEWTHACRAGNATVYGFGDNEREFGQFGWYSGNSDNRTHTSGEKRPNIWGFHDMHGNVWEWCFDRDDAFSMRVISDLKGDEGEGVRAVRGGSWSSLVYACRTANRNWYAPHETASNIGFRVALVRSSPRK